MAEGVDRRAARYQAFVVVLIEFGARLFVPRLLRACGLDDESPAQVRAELDHVQDLVVDLRD